MPTIEDRLTYLERQFQILVELVERQSINVDTTLQLLKTLTMAVAVMAQTTMPDDEGRRGD